MRRLLLETPPLKLLVDPAVFVAEDGTNGFRWASPSTLNLRVPAGDLLPGLLPSSRNPPGLAFVFRAKEAAIPSEIAELPRELAHLHVGALATEEEWALAPWGIDAATDGFFAARTSKSEATASPNAHLELAVTTQEALFWGLHDWVHFHHHGDFARVAETELQCDFGALAWIAWNRAILAIEDPALEALARAVAALTASRLVEETVAVPAFVSALLTKQKMLKNGAIAEHLMETCINVTTAA